MKALLLILLCAGAVAIQGSTHYQGLRTDIGSYVATQIQDQTFEGEHEHDVREFWFDGRSSWRVVCVECTSDYSADIIVIGRKAWELEGSTWTRGNFDSLKFPTWSVHALIASDFDLRAVAPDLIIEGPVVDGEPTCVVVVDLGDYGEFMTNGLDNEELAASLRKEFRGTVATARYVIGIESNRLYQFVFTAEGPKVTLNSKTTVDYGAEVSITRPD
jgi:hypothetical protein